MYTCLKAACQSPWLRKPSLLPTALVSLSREARGLRGPAGLNGTQASQPGMEQEEEEEAPYNSILDASLELFKFTIGMGELAFQEKLRFRGVVVLLLAYVSPSPRTILLGAGCWLRCCGCSHGGLGGKQANHSRLATLFLCHQKAAKSVSKLGSKPRHRMYV